MQLTGFTSQFGAHLERLEEKLNGKINLLEEKLDAKIEGIEERLEGLTAKIEHVETSLLTEFHKRASPAEMRARSHAAAIRALDIELETAAERVMRLEGKGGDKRSIEM